MKKFVAAGGMVLALGAGAGVVGAQGPPPGLTLTLEGRAFTVEGAPPAAGPVRVTVRNRNRREADITLLGLKPGATVEQVVAALPRAGRDPSTIERLVSIDTSLTVAGRASRNVTIPARTGTYLVLNVPEGSIARAARTTFTVGPAGTAVAPEPTATIEMLDYRFTAPATLPRNGTIRLRNAGDDLHFAEALRLRPGITGRLALRRLRAANSEREFGRIGRLFAGDQELIGLVSGSTTNDVEVRFRRPGTYALVCFYGDRESGGRGHNTLGMQRIVTVR